jgi:asparagine synthetase B (glutamine-hydrolysing)
VRVVLTGGGGDQLMRPTGFEGAHYLRRGQLGAALDDAISGSFHPFFLGETPRPLPQALWTALRGLAVQGAWALAPGAVTRLKAARRAPSERSPWLSPEAAGIVDAHLADAWAATRRVHPDLAQAESCRGLGDMLYNALQDRAGAYLGFEHRHPFMDVRVLELVLSLPIEHRFTLREGKRVLRRAMRSTLPALVRERRDKADFTSYVRRAFLTDRRGEIQRLLLGGRLQALGLVQAEPLRRLLEAPPDAQDLMGVANLVGGEAWLRDLSPRTIHPHPSQPKDHHEHA